MKHMIRAGALASTLALVLSACGSAEESPATDETSAEALSSDAAAASGGTAPASPETEDALVEGTEYNATTIMDCGFDNKPPTQSCNAGVKRNWGEDGTSLVEVTKPDGSKRAIFVRGTEPYGADSAQADGSAGWEFNTTREGDQVTVKFGPETYVIVDALITGG